MAKPDLDLQHLPNGQLGWARLVRALAATDDRDERHYLEMKSQADLTTKVDRAKVAKFVLGAANRMPDRAARYFDGHAVMVLGVAHEQLTSIPPFEPHEVEQYVATFTGTPGPSWDFQSVSVDDADVVVIFVDPPRQGDPLWACMADGPEKLVDGRIYTRDGSTRPATGADIRMLAKRTASPQATAELDVTLVGSVVRASCDSSVLDTYIDTVRTRLLGAHAIAQGDGPLSSLSYRATASLVEAMSRPEDRSFEQYKAEIDKWADQTREVWPGFVMRVLAANAPRTLVRVKNLGDIFLEGLRVDIHVAGDVDGLDVYPPELMRSDRILPTPPREWGPKPPAAYEIGREVHVRPHVPMFSDVPMPGSHGQITFNNGGSVNVAATFDELRPRDSDETLADDLVLYTPADDPGDFEGTWRVTAKDHHVVYEGDLIVSTDHDFDLTSEVRRLMTPSD